MPAELIEDNYQPSEKEPFMNDRQRDYFRQKLLAWKEDILREAKETLIVLQRKMRIIPILPTAPLPKRTAPSNCAPATASAS